jgi:hypothetical protein
MHESQITFADPSDQPDRADLKHVRHPTAWLAQADRGGIGGISRQGKDDQTECWPTISGGRLENAKQQVEMRPHRF